MNWFKIIYYDMKLGVVQYKLDSLKNSTKKEIDWQNYSSKKINLEIKESSLISKLLGAFN